jgi:hypothetical protein
MGQEDSLNFSQPHLTLFAGDGVTVIVGSKTYRGTLVQEGDRWYVKLAGVEPGETDEVVIAKL